MNKTKLKRLENAVMSKAQDFMNKDPALKIIYGPIDIACGTGCIEVTLAKENEYHEQTEKIIITNVVTGPNTTEIHTRKLWDWRSGGYWNRQSDDCFEMKY